jgi:multidrug efflux pump subunit AcrB
VNAGFNLSAWALRHRALVLYVMVMVAVLGVLSYTQLSQSEDPPFTFKVMVIQANWPGATARQMQEEIADRISRKLQETPNVDFQRSYSRPGETQIFFTIRDSVPAADVPGTWYQVRKKVGDIATQLPPGVQGPFFNDEFGDVYTNLFALEGDGYSYAQLHDYAEDVRAELLRVRSVAKVDLIGDQTQRVFVEVDNARLAALGLSIQALADALGQQNAVAAAGTLTTGSDRVFVRPSGQYERIEDIRATLLRIGERTLRLGDVAVVRRGYDDPPAQLVRMDDQVVLGMGLTMQPGSDVVKLGKELDRAVATIGQRLPAGLRLATVTSMPRAVSRSIDDFIESVAEAIGIVLLVSLISLGLRTGLVVVIAIPFVLAVTAWLMLLFDVGLHKISLGTLILALGLLVDDAIIAIEMMKVKLEQGWERTRAAAFAYDSTAFPMLTGTLVTVAGFLPIVLARSSTGEYTRAIFEVSAIALVTSWIAAVIIIPLLGYYLLPQHAAHAAAAPGAPALAHGTEVDVYDTPFYGRLRRVIGACVRHRWLVLGGTLLTFVVAMSGFGSIPKQFFPSSDRPELLVDLRLPEGASIHASLALVRRLEAVLDARNRETHEIESYAGFVGTGVPRFYLPLDQQLPQPNFAQLLVTARDVRSREALAQFLARTLAADFSAAHTRLTRLENGPPVGFPVRFRVQGADIATVRGIAEQVAALMRADARLPNVQFDWDEPAERSVRLEIDQDKARLLHVSSQDVANFLGMNLGGLTVTQYRERDKLIAVDLRAPAGQRVDPGRLDQLTLRTAGGALVPLGQLAQVRYGLEYGVIWERDRLPTITVQSDTVAGAQPIDVTGEIDARLADIRARLPFGYHIEIGGAAEENGKAQASINAQMPVMVLVVLTLLMIQLQSVTRVLMVVLTAPLGLIGVVAALHLFGKPFGFVALLGIIAMFGIIMRNSVILVDQIEQDIKAGHARWEAIVGATVRRFRPITLTAAAAVLALIPLLRSNFFGPMATALMGGITVATVLTLFYVPALYAAWFRVREGEPGPGAQPAARAEVPA